MRFVESVRAFGRRLLGVQNAVTVDDLPWLAGMNLGSFFSGYANVALSQVQNENPWIGAAIRLSQDTVSQLQPVIRERGEVRAGSQQYEILDNTPYDFLKVPNAYMSLAEIIGGISFWLDVMGEAFLVLEREDLMRPPKSMHLVPPFLLYPEQGLPGHPPRWHFSGWGTNEKKFLAPWDVVHIKNYGLSGPAYSTSFFGAYGNPVRGVPPSLPVLKTLATDGSVSRFMQLATSGDTLLSGILKPSDKAKITTEQAKMIASNIKQQISNFSEARRLLVLQSKVDFVESKFNPFDLDFKELKQITREEVTAIYRVNSVLLGEFSEIQSYEGIKTATKLYYETNIIPRLRKITDAFYSNIFFALDGGRKMLDFDLSQVEAMDEYDVQLDRGIKALQAGRTVNEINERFDLGFPTGVKWGDEPLPIFRSMDDEDPPDDSGGEGATRRQNAITHAANDEEGFERDFDTLEAQLYSSLRRILWSIRGEVLKNFHQLYQQQLRASQLFNKERRLREINRMLRVRYAQGFQMALDQLIVLLPDDPGLPGLGISAMSDQFIGGRTWVGARVITHVENALDEIIADALRQNLAPDIVAAKIKSRFGLTMTDARKIARTEVGTVLNNARYEIMRTQGVPAHTWQNAQDDDVRRTHRIHGETVGLGTPFSNGMRYPHDPEAPAQELVNCRCRTVPAKDPLDT